MERFGVPPSKVIEVQALIGDSTDNVPGVPGIGVKTAALLIGEYGDLETLLARAAEIKQPKRRESLITFADQARLSRTLVTLDASVPLGRCARSDGRSSARRRDADELHAQAGVQHAAPARGAKDLGVSSPEGAAATPASRRRGVAARQPYDHPLRRSFGGRAFSPAPRRRGDDSEPARRVSSPRERAAKLGALPSTAAHYETVTDLTRLEAMLDAARDQGHLAFRAKLTSSDPMQGELVGVAFALTPGSAAYVPLRPPGQRRARFRRDGPDRADGYARGASPAQAPAGRRLACSRSCRRPNSTWWCFPATASSLPASTIPASCPMRSMRAAPSICQSSLPAICSAIPA